MTQADFGTALILFIVVMGFALYEWLGPLKTERLKIQRYPLFGVRHDLVMLVANGVIAEEDKTFRFLYFAVNVVLPDLKAMSLRELVSALNKSEISSLEDEKARRIFLEAVNSQDPRVRETARRFFLEVGRILMARSAFVHVTAFLVHRGLKRLARLSELISRAFRVEAQAYGYYRTVSSTNQLLKEAAA